MKTAVQQTSIEAFHRLTDKARQTARIAQFILDETKEGRAASIGKVSRRLHIQTSTVSARMNDLKKAGIRLGVRDYVMQREADAKDTVTQVTVQAWSLRLKVVPVGEQMSMFG